MLLGLGLCLVFGICTLVLIMFQLVFVLSYMLVFVVSCCVFRYSCLEMITLIQLRLRLFSNCLNLLVLNNNRNDDKLVILCICINLYLCLNSCLFIHYLHVFMFIIDFYYRLYSLLLLICIISIGYLGLTYGLFWCGVLGNVHTCYLCQLDKIMVVLCTFGNILDNMILCICFDWFALLITLRYVLVYRSAMYELFNNVVNMCELIGESCLVST